MKEELTTKMHYELLELQGVDKKSFFIASVYGAIQRGIPKAQALSEYNISESEYDANIERVLNDDSWWGDDGRNEEFSAPENMETVFEHHITKEEMIAVLGTNDLTKKDFFDWSQNDHYGLIYRLYTFRGNYKIAKKYADKMPNTEHKIFEICYHDFAKGR